MKMVVAMVTTVCTCTCTFGKAQYCEHKDLWPSLHCFTSLSSICLRLIALNMNIRKEMPCGSSRRLVMVCIFALHPIHSMIIVVVRLLDLVGVSFWPPFSVHKFEFERYIPFKKSVEVR
jgi:hypothetical protein